MYYCWPTHVAHDKGHAQPAHQMQARFNVESIGPQRLHVLSQRTKAVHKFWLLYACVIHYQHPLLPSALY